MHFYGKPESMTNQQWRRELHKRRKPNRHPKHRQRLEIMREKRKEEAEFLASRVGIRNPVVSWMNCVKVTRAEADARRLAEELALTHAKWSAKLTTHGWKETQKGWRLGNKASVPIDQAIRELNASLKEANRPLNDAELAQWLTESGWTCVGPNKDVWMIKNWDRPEGNCYCSLRQAAKINRSFAVA
jgi:hypothetical protein